MKKVQRPLGKLIDRIEQFLSWLVEMKYVLKQLDDLQGKMVKVLIELVKMNNPEIDNILSKYELVINEEGKQLFPRLAPYPHSGDLKN